MSYFPPCSYGKNKIKVKLDLCNYATESDVKNVKDDLADLKLEVNNLDIGRLAELDADKLKLFPVDLSKLSNAVKNVVKKDVYHTKIKDIEDEVPNITDLATTVGLYTRANEV